MDEELEGDQNFLQLVGDQGLDEHSQHSLYLRVRQGSEPLLRQNKHADQALDLHKLVAFQLPRLLIREDHLHKFTHRLLYLWLQKGLSLFGNPQPRNQKEKVFFHQKLPNCLNAQLLHLRYYLIGS